MSIESYVICSDWFIYNIVAYIPTITIINLKQTTKYNNSIINKKVIKQTTINCIYKNLQLHLGQHYDMFIELINKNSLFISGSFIIECILDEKYENSDIDVYSYNNYKNETLNSLEILSDDKYDFRNEYQDILPINNIINNCLPKGKILQRIQLNNTTINSYETFKNHIVKNYDMDICKNIFTIINNKPKLYINNINKIISKKDIYISPITQKTMSRIKKYELREFKIYMAFLHNDHHNYFDDKFIVNGNFNNFIIKNYKYNPAIICKYNKNKQLKSISFMGNIYKPIDLSIILNCHTGLLLSKTNPNNTNDTYVLDMNVVFKQLLSNTIVNNEYKCITIHKNGKDIGFAEIIIINYDNIPNEYKQLHKNNFKTKVCPKNFIHFDHVELTQLCREYDNTIDYMIELANQLHKIQKIDIQT